MPRTKFFSEVVMKKLNIDLQEVKKLYESGMTCGQIAEKFNCSVSCIEQKVKMVTTIRKRSDYGRKKFNENFFEVIDSEIKAYWLGFFFADGWTSKNEKSNAENNPVRIN